MSELEARAGWVRAALLREDRLVAPTRAVPFLEAPCRCVAGHEPRPALCELHHAWPLGLGGPQNGERVPLCGTGHDVVHALHREWAKAKVGPHGPSSRRGNRYLFAVAREGWRRAHGLEHLPLPRR